jgi:hypothetical protein
MMNESKLTLLGVLGLALCCGVPVLLASGALAAAAGALARFWPLTLLGGALFAFGAFKVGDRMRRISARTKRSDEWRRMR